MIRIALFLSTTALGKVPFPFLTLFCETLFFEEGLLL